MSVRDDSDELHCILFSLGGGTMTEVGLDFLIFASETVKTDCPKAPSGGAAYAAAKVLDVAYVEVVAWMRAAERALAEDERIVFQPFTKPETFLALLVEARRRSLGYVPLSSR